MDSIPIIAITGQVSTTVLGNDAFQETPIIEVCRGITKHHYLVTRTEDITRVVKEAFHIATTGRPGPIIIDICKDVQTRKIVPDWDPPMDLPGYRPLRRARRSELEAVVAAIRASKKPFIYAGGGITHAGAAEELRQFAELTGIPVGLTVHGLGNFPADHYLCLHMLGMHGTVYSNYAINDADLLLALGVRFDDRTSSSWLPGYSFTIPPTKLIHVDIDPNEIARNYPVALGLMADVRTFLRQLLAEIDARIGRGQMPAERGAWLDAIAGYRKEWEAFIAPGFKVDTTPIAPQRAVQEIDRVLPEDTILVSDIGVHHNWLIQFCKPKRPDSLIGSMGFGPMGFGVAGALGAKLAAPDRPCVAVVGDGAFLMHANVLATAYEYDIPVVYLVWNNYAYGSIRGLQRGYLGGRELATDFKHPGTSKPYNPDFAAMARAAGIAGVSVDRAADLADAVRAGIASGKPCVIDANIDGDLNPGGAGIWELPGMGRSKPAIGKQYIPEG
jgi:acetolactate synthase-1/2/3 large subunit